MKINLDNQVFDGHHEIILIWWQLYQILKGGESEKIQKIKPRKSKLIIKGGKK